MKQAAVRWMCLLVLAGALVIASSCSSPQPDAEGPAPPATEELDTTDGEPTTGADIVDAPVRRLNVLIYYPAARRDGLVGEPREIFMTAAPGDRAKQILADLISGPATDEGARALPPGTRLRQVFVLEDGTAYIDFSSDLKQGISGGSAEELLAVYSIVNSVALNIPEIRRVGILINGKAVDTLNGHLDLRRPLPPDSSLIVGGGQATVVLAAPGAGLATG
jgi:spore germination protein GerM